MPEPKHIFDDLDALRRDDEQWRAQLKAQANSNSGAKNRARSKELFARIPYDRGLQLYGQISAAAWVVLLELDRLLLLSKQNPISLNPERLYAVGMARSTINKALRQLQEAKVVRVKQWGDGGGRTVVTHLWYPIKG